MHLQCHTTVPQLKRTASGESRGSDTSSASSNRTLLFGEIPSPSSPLGPDIRSRSNSSINSSRCNLIMCGSILFQRFWTDDNIRDCFLRQLPREDLCNVRLVCHDFRSRAAPFLFEDITVNFNSKSFTKPARVKALDKIGHHVKTFTFKMPHTSSTFLPPLINQETGGEIPFHYEPQLHCNPKEPRYGTWEMTNLMVQQYPPLFHAATNVPSFVRAMSAMPNMKHLKINCPDQEPYHRYRRGVVDYALISLRIAIERNSFDELDTLSLLPIHAGGLLYLQPGLGFGATPDGARRWSQIRKLAIHMDSVSSDKATQSDHLRILHSYLRFHSPQVTRLLFRWRNARGPSPFSLEREPCMQRPDIPHGTVANNSGSMRSLKFPNLMYMELENAIMDSHQISSFINRHRKVLAEFNFEDVHLRSGTWDDALAPLTRITGNDNWRRKQEEVMEVPIIFSPVDEEPRILGPLFEETQAERSRGVTLSRWLSKSKHNATAKKAKEHFWESSEHMRKFLRGSVFPWR